MAKEEKYKFPDSLDFTGILFKQISIILEARHKGDIDGYMRNVEGLDHLLAGHWENEKEYLEELKKIDNEYGKRLEMIPNPGDEEDTMRRFQIDYERSQAVFKALIKLIHRCGFLPFRRVFGVIDI